MSTPALLPLCRAEISLQAIRWNFRALRALAVRQLEPRGSRRVEVLSVVKADAYGHGMLEVAGAIAREGGNFFAVSNLDEALKLRAAGFRQRVLLFETTLPELAPALVGHQLTPALGTPDLARALDRESRRRGVRTPVHVKVDTGMGRLGVWHREAGGFIRWLSRLKGIELEGIFTHFPVADTDRVFTERQMDDFSALLSGIIRDGASFRYLHAANSMGLTGYKNRLFNLVRPGVMLYGLYPSDGLESQVALKPAMTVKCRVLMVKRIHKGRGISYGHTFRAQQDMDVAVLPVGYSDGYLRALSNRSCVLINGRRCPVLGRVTMDQTIVDISSAGRVRPGMDAVVLGGQKGQVVSALDLAEWAGTIHYEITCSLGNRLPRSYR